MEIQALPADDHIESEIALKPERLDHPLGPGGDHIESEIALKPER